MASIWQRIGNWFTHQRDEYNMQKAMAQRDAITREILGAQTRQTQEIDGIQGLSPEVREEQQLTMRKELYFGSGNAAERYQSAQSEAMDAIAKVAPDGFDRNFRPEGRGIGAFFGRLFNGRFTKTSRDHAVAEQQQFNSMPGFSGADERRLTELVSQRETSVATAQAYLTQVKEDPAGSDFRRQYFFEAVQALRTRQNAQLPENDPTRAEVPATIQDFGNIETHIPNHRQILGFLRPGEENRGYNMHVIEVLTDLDEHGKFRDQVAARDIVRDKISEIDANVDISQIDLSNVSRSREAYPALERHYLSAHPIMDLCKSSGCFTPETFREIFPTQQDYTNFAEQSTFRMLAADKIRAQLMQEAGDKAENLLTREVGGSGGDPVQARQSKERRTDSPAAGLQGQTTYDGFYHAMESQNKLPKQHPFFSDPTRERVSASELETKAPARQATVQRTSTAPQQELSHKDPSLPGMKK